MGDRHASDGNASLPHKHLAFAKGRGISQAPGVRSSSRAGVSSRKARAMLGLRTNSCSGRDQTHMPRTVGGIDSAKTDEELEGGISSSCEPMQKSVHGNGVTLSDSFHTESMQDIANPVAISVEGEPRPAQALAPANKTRNASALRNTMLSTMGSWRHSAVSVPRRHAYAQVHTKVHTAVRSGPARSSGAGAEQRLEQRHQV